MPKGNRTNSHRNTTKIQEYNSRYKNELDGYKQFAESRRKNRTFTQEQLTVYYDRANEYIRDRDDEDKPYTISGVILALGIDDMSFKRMKDGDYDYRLYEYMDLNNITDDMVRLDGNNVPYVEIDGKRVILIPYSEVIEKIYLMLQEQIETRLYEKGRVGDIFALKSKYGWSDSGEKPQTVNQTLVIATEEQAREAIRLLK